jgi:hypothetical protein
LKGFSGSFEFSSSPPQGVDDLTYDWSVSTKSGQRLLRENSREIRFTSSDIGDADDVVLDVTTSGYNQLFFNVQIPDWALANSSALSHHWDVPIGRIVSGAGTSAIVVDTKKLRFGDELAANYSVTGLRDYCFNKIPFVGVIGMPPQPHALPVSQEIDNSAPGVRAKRKNLPSVQTVSEVPSEPVVGNGPPEPTDDNGTPAAAAEHEYIKVEWPKLVKVDQSFSVIVTYNRVKDAIELTDTTGTVVSRIELQNKLQQYRSHLRQSLKLDADETIDIVAQVKLQSAGLYLNDTQSCTPCETDFNSLDDDTQKWTLNLIAHKGGTQSFNLSLYVKGKPARSDSFSIPQKVWERENLEAIVSDALPTGNQVLYSSVFLCGIGLFFSVRGIKFGNIKILIAGRNIVGRDMAGGNIVHGDMTNVDKDNSDTGGS